MYRLPVALSPIAIASILGLVAVWQVPASSRSTAQVDSGQCQVTALHPYEQQPKPLPRLVCEQKGTTCAKALEDWIIAFKKDESAKKDLAEMRQKLFDTEMTKQPVKIAVKELEEIQKKLKLLDPPKMPSELAAVKLSQDITKAGKESNYDVVFQSAKKELSLENDLVKYEKDITEYQKQLDKLLGEVRSLRSNASAVLAPLAGFSVAAKSAELVKLESNARTTAACLTTAKDWAQKAGVPTGSVQPDPPTSAGNTIRIGIASARFGEFGRKGRSCDALPRVKLLCEYSTVKIITSSGELQLLQSDTKTPPTEDRYRQKTGENRLCTIGKDAARTLCGGYDWLGQPDKQQVGITWTCGAKRFCRTWEFGEDVTMICDGTDTYVEGPNNKCDAYVARKR